MDLFNYIIIAIGFVFGIVLFVSTKKITTDKPKENLKISVVIPVRNEEHNIFKLLSDLKKQSYDVYEIICVDDNSADKTCEVINQFDVSLIEAGELPEGWKGKAWACQQGANYASGDVLLFLDADVSLDRDAVKALSAEFSFDKSCLSVQPYHKMKKTYEQLSLFFNTIQAMATGMGCCIKLKNSGLFGPVFMVSKKIFLDNDGYSHVKNESAEDYSLGRHYCKNDIEIKLYLGEKYISYRMYPLGVDSLIEGWAKNFSIGATQTNRIRLIMIFVYVVALTALPLEIIRALMLSDIIRISLLSLVYVVYVLKLISSSKKLGSFKIMSCILYPILLIAFHMIFLYSIFSTFLFRSTTWKGRKL